MELLLKSFCGSTSWFLIMTCFNWWMQEFSPHNNVLALYANYKLKRSKEWLKLSPQTRQSLGLVLEEDGEFWSVVMYKINPRNNPENMNVFIHPYRMLFEDWLENFQNLHLCHLPPNSVVLDVSINKSFWTEIRDRKVFFRYSKNHQEWTEVNYNGSWVRGVNAGGSYQKRGWSPWMLRMTSSDISSVWFIILDLYWTNTQYFVNLVEQCGNDKSCKHAVVVSLMQKYSKKKRTQQRTQFAEVCLMLDIYKVSNNINIWFKFVKNSWFENIYKCFQNLLFWHFYKRFDFIRWTQECKLQLHILASNWHLLADWDTNMNIIEKFLDISFLKLAIMLWFLLHLSQMLKLNTSSEFMRAVIWKGSKLKWIFIMICQMHVYCKKNICIFLSSELDIKSERVQVSLPWLLLS